MGIVDDLILYIIPAKNIASKTLDFNDGLLSASTLLPYSLPEPGVCEIIITVIKISIIRQTDR